MNNAKFIKESERGACTFKQRILFDDCLLEKVFVRKLLFVQGSGGGNIEPSMRLKLLT